MAYLRNVRYASPFVLAVAAACTSIEVGGTSPPLDDLCVVPERTPGLARLEPWLDGRQFLLPVELVPDPHSRALYLAEMYGKIYRIDDGAEDARIIADLADREMNAGGLRALALHPTAKRAFVVVERPPVPSESTPTPRGLDSELRAYDVRDDGSFDLESETLVLRVNIPGASHTMDTLRFGPDGKLYVSIGDGRTSRFDPTKLLGTILRIDVDGPPPYTVPPDNPFVGDAEKRGEIYAFGFRNPWKFSFDRETGDLWVGDVGETRTEEINRVVPGGNYGWPLLEGADCHPNADDCDASGTILPVFSYTHATGNSITGGYVYRGAKIPALYGKYVYADFQNGGLWAVDLTTPDARAVHLNAGEVRPFAAAIGEDHEGELLVLDWNAGGVYRLVADTDTPERPPFPLKLSETGCFVDNDPTRPAPRVVPYDVNVELWSDGAFKSRFVVLPPATTLDLTPEGLLALPPGGLTIKTFFEQDGARRRPIETRFLGRQGNGEWVAASYEWNAEGTDAVLLEEAKELTRPSGVQWTVPAPAQCFFCHQSNGISLGLDERQLRRYGDDDSATEDSLTQFERLGILRGARTNIPPLSPVDSDAPLEERVRSYVHANCSSCHYQGNRTIFSALSLRSEVPFEDTNLCNLITPGAPETSRLLLRMRNRDIRYSNSQMPPVASNVADPIGTALVEEWISTTAHCPP